MKNRINELCERVVSGGKITKDEAMFLINLPDSEVANFTACARKIYKKFNGSFVDICSLINAKSGECGEDCKFCAQSAYYVTAIESYPFIDVARIIEKAKHDEAKGSKRFCIVTSGGSLGREDFNKVIFAFSKLRKETRLLLDASLGILNDEYLSELKMAGVVRINHNIETSRRFFPNICTTHDFDDRIDTVKKVKKFGFEICCGGIIGLGETREDRVDMALTLRRLDVDSVPLNILNPRPGTPLENSGKLTLSEIFKTIALFRFVLPDKVIKIAGGREYSLGNKQYDALMCGANGIIVGGYLTTKGNDIEKDMELLRECGFSLALRTCEVDGG